MIRNVSKKTKQRNWMEDEKMKYLGCRISLDGEKWTCFSFRTRRGNLRGAWLKLWVDYGGEYLPKSGEEFIARGGRIDWFRSFGVMNFYVPRRVVENIK